MGCCSCYGCCTKTNAFFVAILSIAVLAISSAVLLSAVSYDYSDKNEQTNLEENPPSQQVDIRNPIEKEFNITEIPSDSTSLPLNNGTKLTHGPLTIEGFNSTIQNASLNRFGSNEEEKVTTHDAQSTLPPSINFSYNVEDTDGNQMSTTTESFNSSVQPQNTLFEKLCKFWKGKSDIYIQVMQASSGTGIFAGFLQLAFSWFLICGSSKKDLKERTKLWNLSNFITLILLLVIILVPLSYNTSTNSFKGASMFGKEIIRKIKAVEFSNKTLEIMWNSVSNFLDRDLTLFYYVLGADAVVLLVFLLPPLLCCLFYPCSRCCCKTKSTRTDSDLMLFGPNEPF